MNITFRPIRFKVGPICIIGLSAIVPLLSAGCSIVLDPAGGNPMDDAAPTQTPDSAQIVTVQFRNLTLSEAVDVEFYLTDQPLEFLPDDLFQEAFRVRAEIGVAGTGIIEPLREDIVRFPCGPNLTLGTAGGLFLDNDSGAEQGVGTPRWAQESALGLCGNTIVFDFVTVGNGFETIVRIGG